MRSYYNGKLTGHFYSLILKWYWHFIIPVSSLNHIFCMFHLEPSTLICMFSLNQYVCISFCHRWRKIRATNMYPSSLAWPILMLLYLRNYIWYLFSWIINVLFIVNVFFPIFHSNYQVSPFIYLASSSLGNWVSFCKTLLVIHTPWYKMAWEEIIKIISIKFLCMFYIITYMCV